MRLFDRTMSTLQSALDVRLERQNLLAGNVANADTPGYRPSDVNFNAAFGEALRRHDPVHTPAAREGDLPLVVVEPQPDPSTTTNAAAGAPGIDGNRVDLDRTMASLAENALQYQANTRSLSKKLAIIRMVTMDGAA